MNEALLLLVTTSTSPRELQPAVAQWVSAHRKWADFDGEAEVTLVDILTKDTLGKRVVLTGPAERFGTLRVQAKDGERPSGWPAVLPFDLGVMLDGHPQVPATLFVRGKWGNADSILVESRFAGYSLGIITSDRSPTGTAIVVGMFDVPENRAAGANEEPEMPFELLDASSPDASTKRRAR